MLIGIVRFFVLASLSGLLQPGSSFAAVDLLPQMKTLDQGYYEIPDFEGRKVVIRATVKNERMRKLLIQIEDQGSVEARLVGQMPIFEPNPITFYLYHAKENFRRTQRGSLKSLKITKFDGNDIIGYLAGVRIKAIFRPINHPNETQN